MIAMAAMTRARRGRARGRSERSRRGLATGRHQAGQGAAREYLADDMVYTHGGGQTETKAQYIANVTKGPSHYLVDEPSATQNSHLRQDRGAVGPRGREPAKGELYRVRTLEVYTQNGSGVWQMAQKESVRVPMK